MKSITVLGITAALIAFGAVPANAHVKATTNAVEASEASTPRLDATPSNYRRGGFSGGRSVSFRGFSSARSVSFHRASVRHTSFHRASVRHTSFHRASVRHTSFHRHHFARAHVRFGGGHRASPTRLANYGYVRYPRVTYNPRVQTPRIQSPRTRTTNGPRPNWRNNPLLNVRSG